MADEVPILTNELILDEKRSTGLIPRNYSLYPSGYQACAPTFDPAQLIPENEYASRLKDQQDAKASLYDLREMYYDILKSLDQNGYSLCWGFSTTKSVMYEIVEMGGVHLVLSAWWLCGVIKGWRDQGGWGSASLERAAGSGIPAMSMCPSYKSSYDTPATRANAALHKVTEWWDGTESREQNRKIMISAFLMGKAPVLDFNHIAHSMCGCRLVSIEPLVIDCDNSWGEGSGTKGLYRLEGSKAVPDGIVVPRVTMGG